jgi:hypothetical protein
LLQPLRKSKTVKQRKSFSNAENRWDKGGWLGFASRQAIFNGSALLRDDGER